jgi:hypothetical protein
MARHYFTDLEPGSYVLTNLLPVEIGSSATVGLRCTDKPGDIATGEALLCIEQKDKTSNACGKNPYRLALSEFKDGAPNRIAVVFIVHALLFITCT